MACGSSRVLTVVLTGSVPAAPTTFSLKTGPSCSAATILGPSYPEVIDYCPGNPNSGWTSRQLQRGAASAWA